MKQQTTGAIAGVILATLSMVTFASPARADAGADIKALEDAPGQTLVVFDVVPPRQ